MSDEFSFVIGRLADDFSLVPPEFVNGTDVPFIDLILVTLGYGPTYGLSAEPAVRDVVRAQPGMYEQVRELGFKVAAAGLRVRDSGQLKSDLDDRLKYYSPDEIWAFDLAVDLIAALAGLEDLSNGARFSAVQSVRDLHATGRGHTWHKQLRHAGSGPLELRALRARVPQHTPNPARY
jgi:hypothetical protein